MNQKDRMYIYNDSCCCRARKFNKSWPVIPNVFEIEYSKTKFILKDEISKQVHVSTCFLFVKAVIISFRKGEEYEAV